MNYIDIKEAIKATGKSEKTIRRFLSKIDSKPFVDKKGNKLLVDVNYLLTSYPPLKNKENMSGQNIDMGGRMSIDIELSELKNKLSLYEQEIRYKDELLSEKDNRIVDLQKAMLLLEAPKEQQTTKKKKWWQI